MSEEVRLKIHTAVHNRQITEGIVSLQDLREELKDIDQKLYDEALRSLLMDGSFMELQEEGAIRETVPPQKPVGTNPWFNPEALPWEEKIPKSASSKKKGPYYNTPENKRDPNYMELLQRLTEAVAQNRYNIEVEGITYWFDNFNGGISRRKASHVTAPGVQLSITAQVKPVEQVSEDPEKLAELSAVTGQMVKGILDTTPSLAYSVEELTELVFPPSQPWKNALPERKAWVRKLLSGLQDSKEIGLRVVDKEIYASVGWKT